MILRTSGFASIMLMGAIAFVVQQDDFHRFRSIRCSKLE